MEKTETTMESSETKLSTAAAQAQSALKQDSAANLQSAAAESQSSLPKRRVPFMSPAEWFKAGVTAGTVLGAAGLTLACGQYCAGPHEVLGVMTTGALIGFMPGAVSGQICSIIDR